MFPKCSWILLVQDIRDTKNFEIWMILARVMVIFVKKKKKCNFFTWFEFSLCCGLGVWVHQMIITSMSTTPGVLADILGSIIFIIALGSIFMLSYDVLETGAIFFEQLLILLEPVLVRFKVVITIDVLVY